MNYEQEFPHISKRSLKASPEGIKLAKRQFDSKGWTQEFLSIEVGVKTRQPIWRFFGGKPIERFTFFEICDKLDLDWREIAADPPAEPDDLSTEERKSSSDLINTSSNISKKLPCGATQVDKRHYGLNESTHQYCAEIAAKILKRDLQNLRLITCNLDKGCSLAAVHNGDIIDTATGFTPLEGLMIDYSSGSIDTTVLFQMMREDNNIDNSSNVERETDIESSLVNTDNQALTNTAAMNTDNSRAKEALDIYIHRLRSCLGSMLMILGGMDALVFTAELGENSEIVRELVCHSLKFLGLEIDLDENQNSPVDSDIATTHSKVRVLVINTQET